MSRGLYVKRLKYFVNPGIFPEHFNRSPPGGFNNNKRQNRTNKRDHNFAEFGSPNFGSFPNQITHQKKNKEQHHQPPIKPGKKSELSWDLLVTIPLQGYLTHNVESKKSTRHYFDYFLYSWLRGLFD
ncbi:MAG: hypothetical protein ACD_73C00556G0002 [uncultured bacterium]|nr:MAG: hypothetical protein ACD_73C00556G0002 [uncultured bacterium]